MSSACVIQNPGDGISGVRPSGKIWPGFVASELLPQRILMYCNTTIGIGDVLFRSKCLGLVQHLGVVINHDTVLSNTPERGEHCSTIAEFAHGQELKVQHSGAQPHNVIARARQILANPKKYHLINRNCQHTTTEAVSGTAQSPLVVLFWVIAGVCFLIWLVRHR
jgi:hypothetical protein